jgi:hypothetical protein
VAKSVKHRVLSDWTALLVLETEEDYARYGIDRAALADVIEVSDAGALRVVDRRDLVVGGGGGGEDARREERLVPRDPTIPVEGADGSPPPPPPPLPPARLGTLSEDGSFVDEELDIATEDLLGVKEEPVPELESDRPSEPRPPSIEIIRGVERRELTSGADGGSGGRATDGTVSGTVEAGAGEAEDRMDISAVAERVRRYSGQLESCYEDRLRDNPDLVGEVEVAWTISDGRVTEVAVSANSTGDQELARCLRGKIGRWSFEPGLYGRVSWPFSFRPAPTLPPPPPRQPARSVERPKIPAAEPWAGPFDDVMKAIAAGKREEALTSARAWREESPGDEIALLALGEALEALDRDAEAARAYGSLIDLFPSRADIRRMAGERLERAGAAVLASDTYEKAVAQRQDHPSGHHLLAMARVREERWEEAFAGLETALATTFASRFRAADRILREDLGLVAAAWKRAEPDRAEEIARRLEALGVAIAEEPSTRFVLVWETDANDVDFHVYDGQDGHAWYSLKQLESGGALYADVTEGYGPECFTIPGVPKAAPYTLRGHYYRRGPMGYGMGLLQVIRHDGKGTLTIEPRPFVVMVDQAYVDLGVVK